LKIISEGVAASVFSSTETLTTISGTALHQESRKSQSGDLTKYVQYLAFRLIAITKEVCDDICNYKFYRKYVYMLTIVMITTVRNSKISLKNLT